MDVFFSMLGLKLNHVSTNSLAKTTSGMFVDFMLVYWGPFYKHDLKLIPAWMSNHLPSKMGWNSLSIRNIIVEVWKCICNLISHFIMDVFFFIHAGIRVKPPSEKGPWTASESTWPRVLPICFTTTSRIVLHHEGTAMVCFSWCAFIWASYAKYHHWVIFYKCFHAYILAVLHHSQWHHNGRVI